jgi:subtilisin family serine protease
LVSFDLATVGNDINVINVWKKGIFGTGRNLYSLLINKGIKIAIVDDGVQWRHEEFQCNYIAEDSFDIDRNQKIVIPGVLDNHGTSCAGL